MGSGIRLGRLFGIAIHLDWSLLIIFALVVVSLGAGSFPHLHPDWTAATAWLTALVAAVLFFASVLAHELSHALVGRAYGIRVPRITLFIFGGLAQLDNEPGHWRGELWMALAGPAASLLLGAGFLALAGLLVGADGFDPARPRESLAALSPLATLLLWLGPINILLGLFNLVPGFPLDGGRVLRALMWGATGNVRRATRWASRAGQAFAWLLIAAGVAMVLGGQVPVFGRGAVSGLWLAFIGWFLNNAALASYHQLLTREALGGVPVARLMRSEVVTVDPGLSVAELVEAYLLRGSQRAFPVVTGGRLAGLVTMADVRGRERSQWPNLTVAAVMTPVGQLATVTPEAEAFEAMTALSRAGVDQLPVVSGDRLRGLVRRQDILTWMALYGDPAIARELG